MYIKKYTRKGFKIKKSINFRIDEELVKEFDQAIKKTGIKKTFVIEECLKNYVKKVNNEAKSNR